MQQHHGFAVARLGHVHAQPQELHEVVIDPFEPRQMRLAHVGPHRLMLSLHRRTRRADDLDTVPLHVRDERRHVGRAFGRWRQRRCQGWPAEPGVPKVFFGTPGASRMSMRITSVSKTNEWGMPRGAKMNVPGVAT